MLFLNFPLDFAYCLVGLFRSFLLFSVSSPCRPAAGLLMNYSRGCDAVLGLMGPLSTPSSPTSTGGGGGGGGCSSGSDGYHSDSDSDETKYLPPRLISELIKLAETTLFVLLVLLPFFNAFLFRFSYTLSFLRLCPARNHNQLINRCEFPFFFPLCFHFHFSHGADHIPRTTG